MRAGLILGLAATVAIASAYADNITVNSSAAVTFLSNDSSTTNDFPAPFTPANFTAAQTGPHAAVLTSTPFYITAPALTTAGAQWIGTSAGAGDGSSPGYTALFAVSFTIPDAFVSGSLTLNFEVDNVLGSTNPGIYLNGVALPNSTGIPGTSTDSFLSLHTYSDSNVTADLVQGTNWLYINGVNLGAEAGLIFSANISTANPAVPEPGTVWLLATALIALAAVAQRRRHFRNRS